MANEIWISRALTNGELSNKLGIRAKYFGYNWEEPTHIVPPKPDKVSRDLLRQSRGEYLRREDFPEACYVFDPKRFENIKDFFFLGGFAAVKGQLADVIAAAELGTGGLIQIPVFEANKKTQIPGPFFGINFPTRETCVIPKLSRNLDPILSLETDGVELWGNYAECDSDISLSNKALAPGPDLWIDPKLQHTFFVSESLFETMQSVGIDTSYLKLLRCRIVD